MGTYTRMLMKTNRQYRLQVAEAALEAINAALDRIPSDDPVPIEVYCAIGAWREGIILDPESCRAI